MNKLDACQLETHATAKNVWSVLAPYSAAAETEQGLTFYKRLYREPLAVHKKLQHITNRLMIQINQRLPQIVSIADPYASPQTLSEEHCRCFSLPYLIRLLQGLNPARGGIVHLCPYITKLLEKNKLVQIEPLSFAARHYRDVLNEYSQSGKLVLTGKQCIHTNIVDKLFLLHFEQEKIGFPSVF
ncbi:hypothetical protein FACS189454_07690 [Planctomycetales bacterium]|nr:hypothetical protein FACS189454_07690 [Planctomycetales bacterium]